MTRALSVPIESERGSMFLFWRIFFTRTGVHFARKCSSVTGRCARRERPYRCTSEAYDEFASSHGASPVPKIERAYRVRGLQGNRVSRRVVAEPLASSVEYAAALALAGRVKESKSAARRALELEPNSHVCPIEQLFDRFGGPHFFRPPFDGRCHVVEQRTRQACSSCSFKRSRWPRATRSSPRRGSIGGFGRL